MGSIIHIWKKVYKKICQINIKEENTDHKKLFLNDNYIVFFHVQIKWWILKTYCLLNFSLKLMFPPFVIWKLLSFKNRLIWLQSRNSLDLYTKLSPLLPSTILGYINVNQLLIDKFLKGSWEPSLQEFFLHWTSSQMSFLYSFPGNLHLDRENKLLQTSSCLVNCEINSSQIKVGLQSPLIVIFVNFVLQRLTNTMFNLCWLRKTFMRFIL